MTLRQNWYANPLDLECMSAISFMINVVVYETT